MHEMSIANSIIETVQKELSQHPLAQAERVGVRIGQLAAVDASALQFCFEVLVRNTDLESLQLEIEIVPRRHRCTHCAGEFEVRDYDFRCPSCKNFAPDCIGGDELELAFLEVEEHESTTA